MNPIIFTDRLASNAQDLHNQMYQAAEATGLIHRVKNADGILIKPNLTFPYYKKGVTTRVEFVSALVDLLVDSNNKVNIYIAEGEGGYNSFSMTHAMQTMGFGNICEKYAQVRLVNLSQLPSKQIVLKTLRGEYHLGLPSIFFDKIDFSISCPLPKVHAMTKVTLSLKNLWGCLPDTMRLKNHYMLPHIISRISELLKFEFAFLDGKYGLTSNGPMDGDPVEVNWFVASNSLGAFDSTVAKMMGFDWRKVSHLKIASHYGLIPTETEISYHGSIEQLKYPFRLKKYFWRYPALIAFHSKSLTQLFYLSRYAKILHDIMYTFRKRAIPLNQK
jgi:uncharacterized protein (DUF362 family)